jgi:glycosyltransferase involved in cell wall biosynthesis
MEIICHSLVVPLYNEEAVIEETHRRLTSVMSALREPYEIIYVNDGSIDRTGYLAREICESDPHAKLLTFSRNFGHQTAITAGMDHASGEAVIVIDADLQDPPDVIPKLIERWHEGFDVVYGHRVSRNGENWFKRFTARRFYRLLNRMTDIEIPVDAGDFRLISARVRDALLTVPEHNRYVRGLISWLGFRQAMVDYVRVPRFAGKTKYPLKKMIGLAIDGITSFSYKPLKMGIGLGMLLSAFSFCFLLFVFISRLFNLVIMEPGYASMMCVMLFFFGIVLMMFGVIGEYIGRIFEEVKGRPLYIISDKIGEFGRSGRTDQPGSDSGRDENI